MKTNRVLIKIKLRFLAKYLNRYGVVTMLDFLTAEEVQKISKDYILELRK